MEKVININGVDVKFKATASTPRRYREYFNRDLFRDIASVQPSLEKGEITSQDLSCFENLAYTMAKQSDPEIGDINEWLDKFEMLSIYQILPQLIELWSLNMEELNSPKKKVEEQSDR